MATIKEDYVSFETAKLLKEKGFDSPCMGRYSVRSKEFHLDCTKMCNNGGLFKYAAPSQAMAMKWLREIHNIHIAIGVGADVDNPNHIFYAPSIATFIPHKSITYLDGVFEEEEYDTAEQACEAALNYCLENLI